MQIAEEWRIEADETGDEGARARIHPNPKNPTIEEIEGHNVTHIPYRSWCPICVQAKGKELDHTRDSGTGAQLGRLFPGDMMGFKWTVLVWRERMSNSWMATSIPTRGDWEIRG